MISLYNVQRSLSGEKRKRKGEKKRQDRNRNIMPNVLIEDKIILLLDNGTKRTNGRCGHLIP